MLVTRAGIEYRSRVQLPVMETFVDLAVLLWNMKCKAFRQKRSPLVLCNWDIVQCGST